MRAANWGRGAKGVQNKRYLLNSVREARRMVNE
jgi:hypothetical protein